MKLKCDNCPFGNIDCSVREIMLECVEEMED